MHPTGAASLPAAPEAEVQAMHSMDWLFKKERIYLLAQFWQQRATLAEKEVTTLKEQLATTSPTPLQATVPPKTNGSHIEPSRDQETRIEQFSPDIKEEKRRTPDIDEDIEQKIEMAATARSNSNSSRSSPVVNQGNNLESELAAKEKEQNAVKEPASDRTPSECIHQSPIESPKFPEIVNRFFITLNGALKLYVKADESLQLFLQRNIMLRFSELGPNERPHTIPPPKDIFGHQNQ
ncbi:homeobox protein cut-like [Zerene cesonia]|uniref:homeobox protein cut-like n=1 Tax=Zerene cesonia TaxID=33412 RepID=UPI0018E554D5|nr:homeobox protein cut-like [Zerene cesonia]